MLFNVAIDTFIGMVPVAGDLFDFAWKANDMNMSLLERHAFEERPASAGDWLFVIALTVVLLAVATLPFLMAWWIMAGVTRLLS
jgi:hypothetical protein